jgi:hypothetical protein
MLIDDVYMIVDDYKYFGCKRFTSINFLSRLNTRLLHCEPKQLFNKCIEKNKVFIFQLIIKEFFEHFIICHVCR